MASKPRFISPLTQMVVPGNGSCSKKMETDPVPLPNFCAKNRQFTTSTPPRADSNKKIPVDDAMTITSFEGTEGVLLRASYGGASWFQPITELLKGPSATDAAACA
jgi:hypothetical protein